MNLSMTSDYASSSGNPEPYLKKIAEAGFTHVHWCHEWNTDYLYTADEITKIAAQMKRYNMKLTDLHGSMGVKKSWGAFDESVRQAGVELVKNRIGMAASFGSDVVIMHIPAEFDNREQRESAWPRFLRTLDELQPFAKDKNVRIAIENGEFELIEKILSRYDGGYIGLCYDSGHGNLAGNGLECLEKNKARLISIHLHDNDGASDQHKPLFTGTVDWQRLAKSIQGSAYNKWPNLETGMWNSGIKDEMEFLKKGFKDAACFAGMTGKKQ